MNFRSRHASVGFLLLFGWAVPVHAQAPSCLDPTQSWSWTYTSDPIVSINYYLDSEVLDTQYASGIVHLLYPVPINTAQRFQSIGYGVSPDAIWAAIRYSYLEILQGQDNCPQLSATSNYLLSAPQHDTPN